MATLTQTIDTASPAVSDNFNEIYEQIRDFITAISERMDLDHAFDGTENDDTNADCDGFHKKITMRGDLYDTTDFPENIPECPTNGFVFFSIGGELCCYDGNTAKQITDGGNIAIDTPVDETSGISTSLIGGCYGNGISVAVGSIGKILTSTDGTTWAIISLGFYYFYGACYGNGLFVAVGDDGIIFTSADGSTWTSRTSGTTSALNCVAYCDGLYVAVGNNTAILTSSDGITWSDCSLGDAAIFHEICYNDGLYVIVGTGGGILTSTDGTSWTLRTSGKTSTLRAVCYGNGLYVISGDSGVILTSPDGITWTSRTSGTTNSLRDVCYGNGKYIAGGYNGVVLTSPDGITWTSMECGTTAYIQEIFFTDMAEDYLFVLVGASGKILTIPKYITLP